MERNQSLKVGKSEDNEKIKLERLEAETARGNNQGTFGNPPGTTVQKESQVSRGGRPDTRKHACEIRSVCNYFGKKSHLGRLGW